MSILDCSILAKIGLNLKFEIENLENSSGMVQQLSLSHSIAFKVKLIDKNTLAAAHVEAEKLSRRKWRVKKTFYSLYGFTAC